MRPGGSLSMPRYAWLPLVIPLCFVVATWSVSQIEFAWLLRPLAVILIVVVALTLVGRLLLGPLLGTEVVIVIAAGFTAADVRIPGLSIVFASVLVLLVRGSARDLRGIQLRVLGAYRAVAVVLILMTLAGSALNGSLGWAISAVHKDITMTAPADDASASLPDIWLVLLDGYPGDDALAQLGRSQAGDPLREGLVSLGFDVQRHSRTSYPLTRLVLASMFNGKDVPELIGTERGPIGLAVATRELRSVLEDSTALRDLGRSGYERIAISTGWAEVGPRRVDRLVEPPQMTEFEVALLRRSALGTALAAIAPDAHSQQLRDRIATTFSVAEQIAREPHTRPRFVFVHVPAPHSPVVFGPSGEPVNGSPGASIASTREPPMARDDRISRQAGELPYVNQRALDLSRAILASQGRPTAIVVFSDHGSDVDWNPDDPLAGGVNERSSNIVAVRATARPGVIPAGTTTTNLLSRLLNAYSITEMPMQPEGTWFYRTPANIIDLVRVDPASGRVP